MITCVGMLSYIKAPCISQWEVKCTLPEITLMEIESASLWQDNDQASKEQDSQIPPSEILVDLPLLPTDANLNRTKNQGQVALDQTQPFWNKLGHWGGEGSFFKLFSRQTY